MVDQSSDGARRRDDPLAPPPAFRMEREPSPPGVVLMAIAGEVDLATSGHFRALVEEALAEAAALVADLSEVTFMDSTMLRELLRAHRDLDAAGRQLVLASPQPAIRRLLELTGTSGFFAIVDSREAALAAAQAGGTQPGGAA